VTYLVPSDAQIGSLAAKQFGHVTRQQLTRLGLSRTQIEVRLEKGQLIAVHRGVYAVGHPRPEGIARAAAAVLACGPHAVLSHFSAAAVWGLGTRWPTLHEVTIAAKRRPSGIWVHVCPTLDTFDIRRHRGIRLTSPARTLLDIAPRQTKAGRERAVSQAVLGKLMRVDQLAAALRRYPHHPGVPLLNHPPELTRSEFERRFPLFCKRYNLPTPRMNALVAGNEVDALFPAEKLIVELDSWQFHKDRRAFEHDRERDAATLAAAHATIRITSERFREHPDREAARLHSILESRR
jgi:Transcriptional regulator, AbiEi antitoxin